MLQFASLVLLCVSVVHADERTFYSSTTGFKRFVPQVPYYSSFPGYNFQPRHVAVVPTFYTGGYRQNRNFQPQTYQQSFQSFPFTGFSKKTDGVVPTPNTYGVPVYRAPVANVRAPAVGFPVSSAFSDRNRNTYKSSSNVDVKSNVVQKSAGLQKFPQVQTRSQSARPDFHGFSQVQTRSQSASPADQGFSQFQTRSQSGNPAVQVFPQVGRRTHSVQTPVIRNVQPLVYRVLDFSNEVDDDDFRGYQARYDSSRPLTYSSYNARGNIIYEVDDDSMEIDDNVGQVFRARFDSGAFPRTQQTRSNFNPVVYSVQDQSFEIDDDNDVYQARYDQSFPMVYSARSNARSGLLRLEHSAESEENVYPSTYGARSDFVYRAGSDEDSGEYVRKFRSINQQVYDDQTSFEDDQVDFVPYFAGDNVGTQGTFYRNDLTSTSNDFGSSQSKPASTFHTQSSFHPENFGPEGSSFNTRSETQTGNFGSQDSSFNTRSETQPGNFGSPGSSFNTRSETQAGNFGSQGSSFNTRSETQPGNFGSQGSSFNTRPETQQTFRENTDTSYNNAGSNPVIDAGYDVPVVENVKPNTFERNYDTPTHYVVRASAESLEDTIGFRSAVFGVPAAPAFRNTGPDYNVGNVQGHAFERNINTPTHYVVRDSAESLEDTVGFRSAAFGVAAAPAFRNTGPDYNAGNVQGHTFEKNINTPTHYVVRDSAESLEDTVGFRSAAFGVPAAPAFRNTGPDYNAQNVQGNAFERNINTPTHYVVRDSAESLEDTVGFRSAAFGVPAAPGFRNTGPDYNSGNVQGHTFERNLNTPTHFVVKASAESLEDTVGFRSAAFGVPAAPTFRNTGTDYNVENAQQQGYGVVVGSAESFEQFDHLEDIPLSVFTANVPPVDVQPVQSFRSASPSFFEAKPAVYNLVRDSPESLEIAYVPRVSQGPARTPVVQSFRSETFDSPSNKGVAYPTTYTVVHSKESLEDVAYFPVGSNPTAGERFRNARTYIDTPQNAYQYSFVDSPEIESAEDRGYVSVDHIQPNYRSDFPVGDVSNVGIPLPPYAGPVDTYSVDGFRSATASQYGVPHETPTYYVVDSLEDQSLEDVKY